MHPHNYQVLCLGVLLVGTGCSKIEIPAPDSSNPVETQMSAIPWFEDQAQLRGLVFHHQSGHEERYLLPEIMGGGAALADFDNDGDLDAYLVQGGELLADKRPPNKLFINRGDGYFKELPDAGGADDTGYGMGAATGDYDNDGDVDLYLTNVGSNVLYQNNGGNRFTDVSQIAGVDDPGWGASATFLDLDGDGDLDLFLTNYVNWRVSIEQDCFSITTGYSMADYCWPTAYNAPARDRLFRNNGDGSFTDVSDQAGLGLAFGNGLGVTGLDANNDGLTDVFVANDMTRNQLWINQGNLRFKDEAMLLGCAVDEHGVPKSGMGVAAADQDNDGDTDILVVNLATQTDSFFRNTGSYFEDATVAVGLATATRRYTRFGLALVDFNNDSHLDIYEANGAIGFSRETAAGRVYAEPDILLQGTSNGRFQEVTPQGGTAEPMIHTSRGLAIGDVNNDGGLDLLVINRDGPVNLLINQVADKGNWVKFRLLTDSGRDAHGATLSANIGKLQVNHQVQAAGSYLTANDPRIHLGLAGHSSANNVFVRWADGTTDTFGDFSVGETIVLTQGTGSSIP